MDKRVAITRVSQISVGSFYRIVGTDSSGLPIPPQVVRIETPVHYRSVVAPGSCKVSLWADCGAQGRLFQPGGILHMDQVNIPEHGLHDRHLEKVPDELSRAVGAMAEQNAEQDYAEMVGTEGTGLSFEEYRDQRRKDLGRDDGSGEG